ncbi:hypothetical protein V22_38850 [Calycomorphotria hydatis]|uniref:Uncharacterized protein n=1 Tax=Calycomorphotria hydatis TaxID=2528027 RepID=A0A517TE17_9PLAN|nr:hypothetical protein V22_38850 [Calycomorphotria hydatis]
MDQHREINQKKHFVLSLMLLTSRRGNGLNFSLGATAFSRVAFVSIS